MDILQNYVWYNIAKLQEVTIVYVSKSRINDAGLTLVYLIILLNWFLTFISIVIHSTVCLVRKSSEIRPHCAQQLAADRSKHSHANCKCHADMAKYSTNKTRLHMMVIGQFPVLLFISSISFSTVVGEDRLSCSGIMKQCHHETQNLVLVQGQVL